MFVFSLYDGICLSYYSFVYEKVYDFLKKIYQPPYFPDSKRLNTCQNLALPRISGKTMSLATLSQEIVITVLGKVVKVIQEKGCSWSKSVDYSWLTSRNGKVNAWNASHQNPCLAVIRTFNAFVESNCA